MPIALAADDLIGPDREWQHAFRHRPGKPFLEVEVGPLFAASQQRVSRGAEDQEGGELPGPVEVRDVGLLLDLVGVLDEGAGIARAQRLLAADAEVRRRIENVLAGRPLEENSGEPSGE